MPKDGLLTLIIFPADPEAQGASTSQTKLHDRRQVQFRFSAAHQRDEEAAGVVLRLTTGFVRFHTGKEGAGGSTSMFELLATGIQCM